MHVCQVLQNKVFLKSFSASMVRIRMQNYYLVELIEKISKYYLKFFFLQNYVLQHNVIT